MRVDDCIGQGPAALPTGDQRGQRLIKHEPEVFGILPGDKITIRGGSHGSHKIIGGPIATLLTTKSANVRSSRSAPRCTLPTFGAVASSRQGSVAHWLIDKKS